MKLRSLVPLSALAALLLSPGRASAEEDPGVRVRGGIDLGVGMFSAPGFGTLPAAGLHLHGGVQFNNLLALYVMPELGFVWGKPTRTTVGAALFVDFTLGSLISIGVGPDAGFYGQDNSGYGPPAPVHHTSGLYGGRLRLTFHPVSAPDHGFRLAVSLDARLLRGRTPLVMTPGTSGIATVVVPMLTIGTETH